VVARDVDLCDPLLLPVADMGLQQSVQRHERLLGVAEGDLKRVALDILPWTRLAFHNRYCPYG
jgi:hypothetical protein